MRERRRFIRLSTRLSATYQRLPSTQVDQAIIEQIGVAGVRVMLQSTIRPGSLIQLNITLPHLDRPVNATGKIIWSDQHETIGESGTELVFEAGVQFVQIDPQDVTAISDFMTSILQFSPPS